MTANPTPMLAHEYRKHKEAVKYPCMVQKKYNGWRVMITRYGIFTRAGKELPGLNHIKKHLKDGFRWACDMVLDGELIYGRGNRQDLPALQKLMGLKKPNALEYAAIELNVSFVCFDGFGFSGITEDTPYQDRFRALEKLFHAELFDIGRQVPAFLILSFVASTFNQVRDYYNDTLDMDGEGVMVRNVDSAYCYGRSKDLLKLKPRRVNLFFFNFEIR